MPAGKEVHNFTIFYFMLSTGVLHKSKCIITNPKITPPLSTGQFVLLDLLLKVLCIKRSGLVF